MSVVDVVVELHVDTPLESTIPYCVLKTTPSPSPSHGVLLSEEGEQLQSCSVYVLDYPYIQCHLIWSSVGAIYSTYTYIWQY